METLITIKTFDIDEVRIDKASPNTERKTQVSRDVVNKFIKFDGERKASIRTEELKKVKPEIDTEDLKKYEENLTLEQVFSKLGKSNAILVKKYGYTSLDVSPETLEKLVNESFEEPLRLIEEQQKEIDSLKEENKRLLDEDRLAKEKQIVNDVVKESVLMRFPVSIDNEDLLQLDEMENNMKLVS